MRGCGRGARFLPFGQAARTASARRARAWRSRSATDRRPRPAQPGQRLRRGPRALALGPVAVGDRQQRRGRVAQERRRPRVVARPARRARAPARAPSASAPRSAPGGGRRTVRAGRAPTVGIAEPLPDQRRVEHDHRRVGRDPDRLAPPDRARAVGVGDPDAGMAGVERGIGKRHRATLRDRERKGNRSCSAIADGCCRRCRRRDRAGISEIAAGAAIARSSAESTDPRSRRYATGTVTRDARSSMPSLIDINRDDHHAEVSSWR